MNLENCPNCGRLFVKNQFRDICDVCYREEEKQFEKVYNYIRKRENRMATMAQVVEATGVEERLIIKFIKSGRLQLANFPNLGYPCSRCGTLIREGKLCAQCTKDLNKQIERMQQEEEKKKEQRQRTVYYTRKEDKKDS
ncbi:TIGR03826 family flagellar region protein [Anoxybacteroides tepidamans]|uniref:TIGR03826 family flagellar region protein n=1 Tax=Anoxybacteroides tepidamans TaxID=265948 RepID=UPI0004848C8E|nr:TIGR03826 family flagellar region protein [Anoxybacillus tepidamans]